jgi:type 2 lantibiotic biosynthesis protein LanM
VLRDALERERLFDRLWGDVEHLPHLARVISAEQKDLWQGDIPIFKTRPGSRDLWTSSNESLRDFFQEPSMRNVQQRFRTLSERDLTSQIWFIRGALATMPDAKAALEVLQPAAATDVIADRQSLLDAACAAGDRLEAIALRDKRQALWIGLSLVDDRNWAVLPLGADLYSGTSGVALFLAYLGAVTGKERYTKLAEAACNGLRNQIRKDRSQISGIGAFTGWGGIIYTLAHLSALWGRGDLLKEAQDRVDLLSELIDHDERHDLIDGAAGCLGGLLSLLRCAPTEHTHAAAAACGEHLLACAKTMTEGIAWTSKIGATCPLTGFAHGAAGIAWALLELAAVTGEERFRKAAQAGMTYERSLFVPEENNWPDFRVPVIDGVEPRDFKPGFGTSWCNGAPGIGLGRLRALRHLHDRPIRDEVDAALESTLARGFNRNDCLCHGDLGNLELLLEASLALDNAWHVQTYRRAANVLARITTSGWRCGNPLQVESPGLMTGVAGIGYGLLRLAEPDRVPSVLTLDPPLGATTLN